MVTAKIRLVFCTYPSLYSTLVLEALLREPHIDVVGVVCSTRVLSKHYSAFYGGWQQFVRSGPLYALYLWWITGGYRRVYKLRKQPVFESVLKKSAIPVLYTDDINQTLAQAFLQEKAVDCLLSAHFNQLIAPSTLALPKIGCLNIHPSLLPDYQGVDPAFYALLQEEEYTGVSVHWQNAEFDKGRLIAQQRTLIQEYDSLVSLNQRLFQQGGELAVACLRSDPQTDSAYAQPEEGRYDSWPSWRQSLRFRLKRPYI